MYHCYDSVASAATMKLIMLSVSTHIMVVAEAAESSICNEKAGDPFQISWLHFSIILHKNNCILYNELKPPVY